MNRRKSIRSLEPGRFIAAVASADAVFPVKRESIVRVAAIKQGEMCKNSRTSVDGMQNMH